MFNPELILVLDTVLYNNKFIVIIQSKSSIWGMLAHSNPKLTVPEGRLLIG